MVTILLCVCVGGVVHTIPGILFLLQILLLGQIRLHYLLSSTQVSHSHFCATV